MDIAAEIVGTARPALAALRGEAADVAFPVANGRGRAGAVRCGGMSPSGAGSEPGDDRPPANRYGG
jgi:hypothetical protein